MVIERIRQFYDLPRRFRIAGLSGAEEFVSYSNARLKAQSMGPEALMRTPVFRCDGHGTEAHGVYEAGAE